jgi:hypothetical protein
MTTFRMSRKYIIDFNGGRARPICTYLTFVMREIRFSAAPLLLTDVCAFMIRRRQE